MSLASATAAAVLAGWRERGPVRDSFRPKPVKPKRKKP